jgi:hypothetical protein
VLEVDSLKELRKTKAVGEEVKSESKQMGDVTATLKVQPRSSTNEAVSVCVKVSVDKVIAKFHVGDVRLEAPEHMLRSRIPQCV